MPKAAIAIFPGSFDPLTNGHLDLIERGSRLVERLIVAILENTQKQPLFDIGERLTMIREAVAGLPMEAAIEVDSFGGLLVDYAARRGAQVILRGMRSVADYESELQMAAINGRLRPGTETMFLMASEAHAYVSSRMVKEICLLGGDAAAFVPGNVAERLRAKLGRTGRRT